MKYFAFLICVFFSQVWSKSPDWLVHKITTPSTVTFDAKSRELVLTNGLIKKTFWTHPGFVCIDYFSFEKRSSLLRALGPEAIIALDGQTFNVGGVISDIPRAYLNRTNLAQHLTADVKSFQFVNYQVKDITARFPYQPKRGAPKSIQWPPKGIHLQLQFAAPKQSGKFKSVMVNVNYELYDGHPILSKWVELWQPQGGPDVRASVVAVEVLHLNWQWSSWGYNWLLVSTDEPHGNLINWYQEEETAKALPGSKPMTMNATYDRDFSISLKRHVKLVSFRVMETLIGSHDMERQGLAKRRLLRLLAPHTQENPIYFHITKSDPTIFRKTIDQLAEVGFEMVLFSFGSGWNLESNSSQYMKQIKEDVAYANAKGIEVGGYDLIALTRKVQPQWMALNDMSPDIKSACFASGWEDVLLKKVLSVIKYTNISVLETDGPYGGYSCAAKNHSHHENEADSVYWQNRLQAQFYLTLRKMNVYLNQPDNYFYWGGSKSGMGYNEDQYSLPRWTDLSVSRQGYFDDTFHFTPTIGWMFLPLEVYHSGGAAAMFEPLEQHLTEFEWGLAQYLGAGIAACYRGSRIYDSAKTKAVVMKWVDFYKSHRDILISDIIHVRRSDMQSIDVFLHVNPYLEEERGLGMFFNPTNDVIRDMITIDLYYTGLTDKANITWESGQFEVLPLDRDYSVTLDIEMRPLNITWMIITKPTPE